MKRLFGTDGVRGKAGVFPLDTETIKNIAISSSSVFLANRKKGAVVIGRDTRESGKAIFKALSEGFTAAGIDVYDAGVIPTPGIAFLTKTEPFVAGIVISASHNPYRDNGIKFFAHNGKKLSDHVEQEIEDNISRCSKKKTKKLLRGKVYSAANLTAHYESFIRSSYNGHSDLSGYKVLLDCANGATYEIAPRIFSELGADVLKKNVTPNGRNINKNCGSLYPEKIRVEILKKKADCGICFDGDGDRVIFIDEKGIVRDGDYLLYVLSNFLKSRSLLEGNTVVSTVMANFGFGKAMESNGIKTIQTKVGDRYVSEEMSKNGFIIGGEQSGHIILNKYLQTGDGMLTALKVLEAVTESGRPLSSLCEGLKKYPQYLLNSKVGKQIPLEQLSRTKIEINIAEKKLRSNGRILVRYSGTEGLIRVMVEGPDEDMIRNMARKISQTAVSEIRGHG